MPVVLGALTVAGALGVMGGSLLNNLPVQAQETTQTNDTTQTVDPAKGGHVGASGVKEEILIGDNAEKAKAAALAAYPGGTIDRVETDAEGAVYEAHMRKSDGTQITVKFDENFKVTGTEEGHGKKPV